MKMIPAGLVLAAAACAVVYPPRPIHGQETVAAASAPQVKDDLFAGTEKFAQGASDVSEVNLDKNMLGMVGKGKDGLAGKMDFIVVHSYTYDKPGMYKQEDLDAYRKKLTDGSWSCFVHTRDKDGSTDVCQRTMPDNETHEMVIMTAEPKELTFVHLRGRMSLSDLGKMGGNMGMGMGAGAGAPPAPPMKKHDN
jgi:hypothetical protein